MNGVLREMEKLTVAYLKVPEAIVQIGTTPWRDIRRGEVSLHAFLILALHRSEWSISCPIWFLTGKDAGTRCSEAWGGLQNRIYL